MKLHLFGGVRGSFTWSQTLIFYTLTYTLKNHINIITFTITYQTGRG